MKRAIPLIALLAACTLQTSSTYSGPRAQPGPQHAPASHAPAPAPASAAASSATTSGVTVDWQDILLFPVSDKPADPWTGVAGSAPAAFAGEGEQWRLADESIPCTALRDHCLPPLAWMWTPENTLRKPTGEAQPVIYGRGGLMYSSFAARSDTAKYVVLRTVPATKSNLAVGNRVVAYPSVPLPPARTTSFTKWTVGTVERIDWDMGFVYLKDVEGPFFLTATRVAVLMYSPTDGLSVLDGRPRELLAVSPADLFLP